LMPSASSWTGSDSVRSKSPQIGCVKQKFRLHLRAKMPLASRGLSTTGSKCAIGSTAMRAPTGLGSFVAWYGSSLLEQAASRPQPKIWRSGARTAACRNWRPDS
jgi:hypothetical protein